MANGKQHWELATGVAVVGSAVALYYAPGPFSLAVIGGLILGKYATPDVRDQEHIKNYAQRRFQKRYGALVGFLWWLYWWPLAKLIPHRSFLSHLPPLATLVAFLYLFAPPLILAYYYTRPPVELWSWLWAWLYNWLAVGILVGWSIQDLGHLAQDNFKIYW